METKHKLAEHKLAYSVKDFPRELKDCEEEMIAASFRAVYKLLTTGDVQKRLTIPSSIASLEQLTSQITIKFILVEDPAPASITHSCDPSDGYRTAVDIYYTSREVTTCPAVITARVEHEATHALRKQIVRQYWESKKQSDPGFDEDADPYHTNTPNQKLDGIYTSAHIPKCRSKSFIPTGTGQFP